MNYTKIHNNIITMAKLRTHTAERRKNMPIAAKKRGPSGFMLKRI
jgi:hypothetical protein